MAIGKLKRLLVGLPSRPRRRTTSACPSVRPRRLRVGRAVLGGVRDRGDPAHPGPRRNGRARLCRSHRDRDRALHRDRGELVPPDHPAIPRAAAPTSWPRTISAPAGLVAGAALLVDYVLTVAVSVAAGVAAITSAFPALFDYRVRAGSALHRRHRHRQPPRDPRIRQALRRPHLSLHRQLLGHARLWLRPLAHSAGRGVPPPAGGARRKGLQAAPSSSSPRFRLGLHGAHRRGGGVGRGTRLRASRVAERPHVLVWLGRS